MGEDSYLSALVDEQPDDVQIIIVNEEILSEVHHNGIIMEHGYVADLFGIPVWLDDRFDGMYLVREGEPQPLSTGMPNR